MNAIDTLQVSKDLQAASFTEVQAEALARLLRKSHDDSGLATKDDLDLLRTAMKADMEQLRTATKADLEQLRMATRTDIAELKADLLKWMVGLLLGQVAVIAALVKLL